MKKITAYCCLREDNPTLLATLVNEAIKDGWQPLGGIGIASFATDVTNYTDFAQAMVKYAEDNQ